MKRVVLITGASSGIGRETARLLNRTNCTVYAGARRVALMEDLEKEGIRTMFLDVTDDDSMQAAVETVIAEQGRIDVLVNNAGFGIYGTVEDVPVSEARRQMEVNVFGLARMTQLVLPHMRRQMDGRIVNLSSVAGKMSMPLGAWYHASKHAVEAISDSLRGEVEPYGIDVIIIEPGIIDTAWWPIAEHNLEEVSGKTAYSALVTQGRKYLSNPGKASDPVVIARTIRKALMAAKPKTRYSAGERSKLILRAQDILPDRVFDRILKKQLEMAEK